MSRFGEWVLGKLCRPLPPDTNPWVPAKPAHHLANFKQKFRVPIEEFFHGRVLELASGNGILAAGMRDSGAGRIVATDHWEQFGAMVTQCVGDRWGLDLVRSDSRQLPFPDGMFDTVICEDGFEHFVAPRHVCAEIIRVLKDGGILLVTFGPPWYSPRGGHMMFLNAPPWFHLIFSERTVFAVRARYRSDGIRTWTEGYCPLSKLSIAGFRRQVRAAGLAPREETAWPVWRLKALTRIPVLREFVSNLYSGIWQK